MTARSEDTIYALASGSVRAGVSVYRISGPAVAEILTRLLGDLPTPRRASVRRARRPRSAEAIDQVVALWFPGPGSFTGEDVGEIHCHGGEAIRAAVTSAIDETGLARPAEAGEFTRRAFLNGRMDLTQVEALGDLIEARTEAQRRQAMDQFEGAFARRLQDWRGRLVRAMAFYEAGIDFPDEEIPDDVGAVALTALRLLREEMAEGLADWTRARRVREGFTVCLLGAPNVGKSSLMNAMAGDEVAIVTDVPGTTRDVIRKGLDMDGVLVSLTDLAGLRDARDPVEAEGVRRAERIAASADLRIWVRDGVRMEDPDRSEAFVKAGDVVVFSKADLVEKGRRGRGLWVSTVSGEGMAALIETVRGRVRALAGDGEGGPNRERHAAGLRRAIAAIAEAEMIAVAAPELAGEHLRRAAEALGRISGAIGVEDILGEVFASFCIGK